MRATVMYGAGDVRVENVPDARIIEPTNAQTRHEGYIRAGGVDKDVIFVDVADSNIIDQVDAAYRSKYRRYDAQYVDPMLTAEARAATIKLVPR